MKSSALKRMYSSYARASGGWTIDRIRSPGERMRSRAKQTGEA
jgi:hypothetical protein